jgi:ferredoxin
MHDEEAPVVVICDDVGTPPVSLGLVELVERVRREMPGSVVMVVPEICQAPKALAGALGDIHPRRVVVGCRHAFMRRAELLGSLRRAGVARGGIDIVDLRPAEVDGGRALCPQIVLGQSAALLLAATVRVACYDLEIPAWERTKLSSAAMSRRSLFGGNGVARRCVAVFLHTSCGGAIACTACVLVCPQGALSRRGGRVDVNADLCNGCGACVTACRTGAFALASAGLSGLQAAAGVLVRAIGRGGPERGVAIACEDWTSAPGLGGQWLVLRVPSLEMVTAGWLLRLVASGVGAHLAPCQEATCQARAADLERFVGALAKLLGFSTEGQDRGRRPEPLELAATPVLPVELREPEATTQSLRALGGQQATFGRWRAAGPGCSLGEVELDLGACSLCEVCVRACPTGALRADRDGAGSLVLSFDPSCCTACGACVASCPEKAVRVDRCADGTSLTAGRRLVATGSLVACDACGAELVAALPAGVLARLDPTHPLLAAGTGRICADCRLGGRTVPRGRVSGLLQGHAS